MMSPLAERIPTRMAFILVVLSVALLFGGGAVGWYLAEYREEQRDVAQTQEKQARGERDVAVEEALSYRFSLEEACERGIRTACQILRGVKQQVDPDDPENQDAEVQEPEIQQPERQDPEPDDGESDDPEQQDSEVDDPDVNDPEVQDPEVQDEESDNPDPDDPENQDPEVDDPDPNSALLFAVDDSCHATPGEFLVDVNLDVVRTPDSVTYVLSCVTALLPLGP